MQICSYSSAEFQAPRFRRADNGDSGMPFYIGMFALQMLCAVHAVRRGHDSFWIWIIIIAPVLGCAVYLVSVVLPEATQGPGARLMKRRVKQLMDPTHALRASAENLAAADTVDNRLTLARELVAHGKAHEAVPMYERLLSGIYENDPVIMLELAKAQFACGDYREAQRQLEALIAHNPDFKSPDGHLLYARCLEENGKHLDALEEYRVLSEYYAGFEPKLRYGCLLKQAGRTEEAKFVFEQLLLQARRSPKYVQKQQQEWVRQAQKELG